ncbi:MAG: peptidoglycan DD-metalloendopeptidase family protein [Bdellovibrio sp.]
MNSATRAAFFPLIFFGGGLCGKAWSLPSQASSGALQKFENTKSALSHDEQKSRALMSQLFETGKKLKQINSQKGQLHREVLYAEKKIRLLSDELLDLKEKIQQQKSHLLLRFRTAQRLQQGGAFQFLFSSNNTNDLLRKLQILEKISQRDAELVKKYRESQIQMSKISEKFRGNLRELRKLQSGFGQQEKKLSQEMSQKNYLLGQIQKIKRQKREQLSELRATGLLDSLLQPSLVEAKGRLPWPLEGKLLQNFGIVQDSKHLVVLPHSGLFIEAPEPKEVRSIFSGEVAHIGQVSGFDHTIVLDHGDHYYSVYASLKSIQVRTKDRIQKGQIIGWSGFSPLHQRSGLYFEIRYFSEPENPLQWMKGIPL